jgi:hypothetical protein
MLSNSIFKLGYDLLNFLPVHTKRRVRYLIIKFIFRKLIIRKRVAKLYVFGILAFYKHIGFADGIRLRVDLLSKNL